VIAGTRFDNVGKVFQHKRVPKSDAS